MSNQTFNKSCEGSFRALLKAANDYGYSEIHIHDPDSDIWEEYSHNGAISMFRDLDMTEITLRSPSKRDYVWFLLVPEYGADGSDLIADHSNTFDAEMICQDWELLTGFDI